MTLFRLLVAAIRKPSQNYGKFCTEESEADLALLIFFLGRAEGRLVAP
jgi:hypothetical protein